MLRNCCSASRKEANTATSPGSTFHANSADSNFESIMIYLDHHSTTPVLPEVWEAMLPYLTDNFGNPSSAHAFGRRARQVLEDARERIAQILGAFPDEVIFTSGATEANNLAVFGLAGDPPGHILASLIEHPCVLEPLRQLAARGFDVEWLPVRADGAVDIDALAQRADAHPGLICLMLVNHETGACQSLSDLPSRFPQSAFHTDAAQTVGKQPVHFHELGVASMSVSGHKFGAPKGIGLLFLRRGVKLRPLLFGGHQQQGRRPGTEPVALAVGLAAALEIAVRRMSENRARVAESKNRLLDHLRQGIESLTVNSPDNGSPYVVNVSFPGCRADVLLMKLDLAGVACSTGSACSSGSLLPSPVLQAMGIADNLLRSAMRFSFSSDLTEKTIDEAASHIIKAVNELRNAET
jgi:cysteine desulfurase